MNDAVRSLKPWAAFAGSVLVVAVLYWGQAVLIPIALAFLLTFVLTPLVSGLQRWIGQIAAVLSIVVCTFAVLGLIGWAFTQQLSSLTQDLPRYRNNIRQKIADVRGYGKDGSVERVQDTITEIQKDMASDETSRGTPGQPVVIVSEQVEGLWGFPAWMGPIVEPMATAGFVIVLVIFMLLKHQDLRNRLIGVIGYGHLTITTKALDEAASRVSRYLLMQSLLNLLFGVAVGIGLYLIGVPYALLWAAMAAILRFIPYIGPWVAAGAPLLVSLAVFPSWNGLFWVAGLFLGLELFTNLVLETFLYAGAAGVSQVGLLIAIAFWTWLWGPLGLLMATPLTVCLVVLGKHLPGLEFIATLMSDVPPLPPNVSYYQRLVARDQSEAFDLIERHIKTEAPESVYDALLLPALNFAERDLMEGRLSAEEETAVVEATRELTADAAGLIKGVGKKRKADAAEDKTSPALVRVPILGYPVNSQGDEVALGMLCHLLEDSPVSLVIASGCRMTSDIVAAVAQQGYQIVCIVDLPPSLPSKTRYLIKKLRSAYPDMKIVVGRWAPSALADDTPEPLLDAGANYIGSTLAETGEYLRQVVPITPQITSLKVA